MRRDYPEPFIALLAFILGIWLWDHYFGENQGYRPETEQIALVKIDRDLRLADAMRDDSSWLRWLAGVEKPTAARQSALSVFQQLGQADALTPQGLEAFGIVKSVQDNLPMREVLNQVLQGEMISDLDATARNLADHGGTWWHARLVGSWEENVRPAVPWRQVFGEDNIRLRTRAVVARSLVWLLGVAGLFCVPTALRCLRRGLTAEPKGYPRAWSMPLGLVVFLVTTLAWIGFSMTLEVGLGLANGLHPALGILWDSVARVLPALLAMALLFRRPSHIVRTFRLNRPPQWAVVLGMFSLLMVLDQILTRVLDSGAGDPGGGLSLGDTGWWGLVFAIVSACLLAPLAEETIYRGVLFGACRNRIGVLPAAILSSSVFALLHFYNGYGLLSVGIFGLACALVYSGTGTLVTAIALHMLYNSAIKIPEWIVYHAPLY